jgi:2-alkenal reductase
VHSRNQQQSIWLFFLAVIVIISLFIGSMAGGFAGYMVAARSRAGVGEGPAGGVQPLPEPVQVTAGELPQERQALVVTEESATIDAVNKVLPAVVTVINRSGMGVGSGSGFFISSDGYLVTNNHVVEGARNITIIYSRGGEAPAALVGTAPEFDLAVLKVEGAVPGVTEWGNSTELPLGANVLAIGSALGEYQNSVTQGILSGFNRQVGPMNNLLQTDAAINSGNSGGPLINLAGQVIGINTMVVRGNFSDAEGLGFAIPSNVAQSVVRNLIETGNARHPFLGIQYQSLNPQLASEAGLSITEGALLDSVLPGTPAERAGLQVGDVVVAINGAPVNDRQPLVSLLLEHVAGDTITLDVLRDGTTFQTQLTLGERA